MRRFRICLLVMIFISCEKRYEKINDQHFKSLAIQDTIITNNKIVVLKVGDSISDKYSQILVKYHQSNGKYLFKEDSELENDSIIIVYDYAFIYDEEGGFRKNGIWVYTKFSTKGTFPFANKTREFNVDSLPNSWNNILPTKEGIYFYKNNHLSIVSTEQSTEKFNEGEMDGFYFIPNKGRLFDKINIYKLE